MNKYTKIIKVLEYVKNKNENIVNQILKRVDKCALYIYYYPEKLLNGGLEK